MPDESDITRKGKIASLPLAVRAEINRRLDDGERAPKILAWLNAEEAVLRVLDELWSEQPINAENLSQWRLGGYRDHVKRREKVDSLKALSTYALELGKAAGGSITDGSAAIAGGRIMTLLEDAADEDLENLVKSLYLIRSGDQEREKIGIRKHVLTQRDQVIDLAKKKFRRDTAELFLKWYDNKKVKEIVESRDNAGEKVEKIGQAMFGEDW